MVKYINVLLNPSFVESEAIIDSVKGLAESLRFQCSIFYHEQSGKSTGDAVRATGLEPEKIIKCLLLKSKDNHYIGAIIRGSDRLDFKALESISEYRGLRMAASEDVERELGFVVGGVPAIIFREKDVRTFVDRSVLSLDYVVGSGGTPFHGMRFDPSQLTLKLNYTLAEIAKVNSNGIKNT